MIDDHHPFHSPFSSLYSRSSCRAPSLLSERFFRRLAMSNDTQKADQIAHRLYTKLTLVVNHARATAEPGPQAKVDKWVCVVIELRIIRIRLVISDKRAIIASSTSRLLTQTSSRSTPASIVPSRRFPPPHHSNYRSCCAFPS